MAYTFVYVIFFLYLCSQIFFVYAYECVHMCARSYVDG